MFSEQLKKIGKRIQYFRKKAGYTSYENFAFDNDLNKMTVWKAESGKDIKMSTLLKILQILNIPVKEFFSEL